MACDRLWSASPGQGQPWEAREGQGRSPGPQLSSAFHVDGSRCPRYQRQLSLAVEREQSLEHEKVQLGLDWQHRCDSVERDRYQKSEELVRGLTTAKEQVCAPLTFCGGPGTAPHNPPLHEASPKPSLDFAQAAAKLQETERKLRDQEAVLKAVTLERDRAVQALRTQGPLPETDAQVGAPQAPSLLSVAAMGNGA